MQKKFLDEYYPAAKAGHVFRQLQDLRQGPNETMYDYLEKFNALEQRCCNLGVPENVIIEYLLDGLRPLDRKLLNASAGGTIMNLSPTGVRKLVAKVAENARFIDDASMHEEFSRTRHVAKTETPFNQMTEDLKQMKEMMQKLIMRQPVQVKPCEFCGAINHKTDACPTLQEDTQFDVNAVGEFQSYNNRALQQTQQQQFYRPSYRQQQGDYNNQNQYQQRGQNYYQAGPSNQSFSKSLEDIVKELAITMQQNQAKNDETLAELGKQMSNLARIVSELKSDLGRLPSQTMPNPRGNNNLLAVVDESGAENEENESVQFAS